MNDRSVTGGDLLVAALDAHGVGVVFGLPGVQLDPAFEALARRESMRLVHARNEQALSYMADGYARASGRLGCCLVVPGPGLLNAMAGLATAYACSSPVLCVAGQVPSPLIDSGLGLLHEIPDSLRMVRSVVKWAARAARPEDIPSVVAEAIRQADAVGRPRPVAVEVPWDVLGASAAPLDELPAGGDDRRPPGVAELERAAGLLHRADHPLIVAGGGVLQSGAWQELRALAEQLAAPVVLTPNSKGAMSSRHPLTCEPLTAATLIPAADVVLAVGTRFATPLGPRWPIRAGQQLVRIDADPDELHRGLEPAVGIESDACQALGLLADLLPAPRSRNGWRDLAGVRERARALGASLEPQAGMLAAIRDALPDDAVVVAGMTQIGYWARAAFPVYEPRTWLTPGYQGALGFELPTGLGAQVGAPGRRVVVLTGDGGFMFNATELATAVQHELPVITVVFNDGAYGNVRRIQLARMGRSLGSELRNPDLRTLADAFGVLGLQARGPDELAAALCQAQDHPGPVLIDVPVGPMPDPWPVLLSDQPVVAPSVPG